MLLSLRKNGLTSLFKEVRVFKVVVRYTLESEPVSENALSKGPVKTTLLSIWKGGQELREQVDVQSF